MRFLIYHSLCVSRAPTPRSSLFFIRLTIIKVGFFWFSFFAVLSLGPDFDRVFNRLKFFSDLFSPLLPSNGLQEVCGFDPLLGPPATNVFESSW